MGKHDKSTQTPAKIRSEVSRRRRDELDIGYIVDWVYSETDSEDVDTCDLDPNYPGTSGASGRKKRRIEIEAVPETSEMESGYDGDISGDNDDSREAGGTTENVSTAGDTGEQCDNLSDV